MTVEEIYELGDKAYNEDNFEEALRQYTKIADENADAAASIPFCYINLASEISVAASQNIQNTEFLVRGQQKAVNILNEAIRSALNIYRRYPDYPYALNAAATSIAQALDLQYSLTASGLTTAYNITTTEKNIERFVKITVKDGIAYKDVLWENVIDEKTESFVSLTSYDFNDYHIFGPDEKTKRVRNSMNILEKNAVRIADLVEATGREFDAHIIRAAVACAMAECSNGDRGMLLTAEWFISRAKELAITTLDEECYRNWAEHNSATFDSFDELADKYSALLKNLHKRGERPHIARFYVNPADAPKAESSHLYLKEQEMNRSMDAESNKIKDFFEVFLTVFAQTSFMKIFPTILFGSVTSFLGGLFSNIFSGVFFVVTLVLTFFRALMNGDEFRSGNTFGIFMVIMLGTAVLFSANFFVGLIVYLILTFLARKYK